MNTNDDIQDASAFDSFETFYPFYLNELGWIGRIEQANAKAESNWVLLIDVTATPLSALAEKLWLAPPKGVDLLWQQTQIDQLKVSDVIKT